MLKEQDNALFQALANTSDNVFLFENDVKSGVSHWSDNAKDYFDFPNHYEDRVKSIWHDKIHPDDQELFEKDIDDIFSGRKNRHSVQYRVKNKYSDYVWVECIGNMIYDSAGDMQLFAGIITRLDNQSKYDPLTKKMSIHHFYQSVELQEACVILMVGMDNFRRVIHSYGYEAGNTLLFILSEELAIPKLQQKVYRMDGDEFLIILPNATKKETKQYFHDVTKNFQKRCLERGFEGTIAFSGAGDVYKPGSCSKETVIKQLEHSMEQAKSKGSGHLVFFFKGNRRAS